MDERAHTCTSTCTHTHSLSLSLCLSHIAHTNMHMHTHAHTHTHTPATCFASPSTKSRMASSRRAVWGGTMVSGVGCFLSTCRPPRPPPPPPPRRVREIFSVFFYKSCLVVHPIACRVCLIWWTGGRGRGRAPRRGRAGTAGPRSGSPPLRRPAAPATRSVTAIKGPLPRVHEVPCQP